MPDGKGADLVETVADLQRELAQRTAERDEAVAQQTAQGAKDGVEVNSVQQGHLSLNSVQCSVIGISSVL